MKLRVVVVLSLCCAVCLLAIGNSVLERTRFFYSDYGDVIDFEETAPSCNMSYAVSPAEYTGGSWIKIEDVGAFSEWSTNSCPYTNYQALSYSECSDRVVPLYHRDPDVCFLRRFNKDEFLGFLQRKQMHIFGDSVSGQHTLSLLCQLEGVPIEGSGRTLVWEKEGIIAHSTMMVYLLADDSDLGRCGRFAHKRYENWELPSLLAPAFKGVWIPGIRGCQDSELYIRMGVNATPCQGQRVRSFKGLPFLDTGFDEFILIVNTGAWYSNAKCFLEKRDLEKSLGRKVGFNCSDELVEWCFRNSTLALLLHFKSLFDQGLFKGVLIFRGQQGVSDECLKDQGKRRAYSYHHWEERNSWTADLIRSLGHPFYFLDVLAVTTSHHQTVGELSDPKGTNCIHFCSPSPWSTLSAWNKLLFNLLYEIYVVFSR